MDLPTARRTFGSECEVGNAAQACETNAVCVNVNACNIAVPSSIHDISNGAPEICWAPQGEGRPCDSNFAGTWNDTEKCFPCQAGLICDESLPRDGRPGTCVRPCDSIDDCPCGADGFTPTCQASPAGIVHCDACSHTGSQCDTVDDCCDPLNDTCAPSPIGNLCCRPDGGLCDEANPCCDGFECAGDGKCYACDMLGEEVDPTNPLGCCPGLVQRPLADGKLYCALPCDENNDEEYCGRCGDFRGPIDVICDGPTPECKDRENYWTSPTPDESVCDGVDDDCDGEIDEDFVTGASCMGSAPNGRCVGEVFEGVSECIEGTDVCVVDSANYCGYRLGSTGLNPPIWENLSNPECWWFPGSDCSATTQCSPGQECSGTGSGTFACRTRQFGCDPNDNNCQICNAQDVCWAPAPLSEVERAVVNSCNY